ncbi:MAG TPA: hypothetical protein VIW92_16510, partial [Thermoanaerobaculia bacterium]
ERVESEMGGKMERASQACDWFFQGRIGQWMVPAARLHPGIRRVLGDLLACRQGYLGLRGRLVGAVMEKGRGQAPPLRPG